MEKTTRKLLVLLACIACLFWASAALASSAVRDDGTFKGIRLAGKVRVVEYNPDIKVQVVTSFPDVYGAYDLVLHNYGPDRFTGSVHIEVSDSMDADALDQLIRDVSAKVYQETGTILTGVGIYSMNTRNPEIIAIRKDVTDLVLSHDGIMQMHGFYLDREAMTMRFDLVVSFEVEDRPALFRKVLEEVRNHYPDYDVNGNMDTDFSES